MKITRTIQIDNENKEMCHCKCTYHGFSLQEQNTCMFGKGKKLPWVILKGLNRCAQCKEIFGFGGGK